MTRAQVKHLPYDTGYEACSCFWGRRPGSLLEELVRILPSWRGIAVLDVGCGEGKNAAFAAQRGATVKAIDASALALRNAAVAWPNVPNIRWERADVRLAPLSDDAYDVVIAYGLLHCMANEAEVRTLVSRLQRATAPGGYNAICTFNNRQQDLRAHPNFSPVLMAHDYYVKLYQHWRCLHSTDSDLHEVHPHNGIHHTHSMTRILARKPPHEHST